MSDVLPELLPVIVGAAAVPLYPIIVLLLLQSEKGLGKAVAFVSGGVAMRLAQGVLFGIVLGAAMAANDWATAPGRGYFAILRLYGPTEPALAKTWKPGDVVKMK